MRKVAVLVGLLVLFTTLGFAAESNITAVVDGLNCSTPAGTNTAAVNAWSFGASNPVQLTGSGGGSAGKPNISDLSVSRTFDSCSPQLFEAVVKGNRYKTVTLIQKEPAEKGTKSDYMQVRMYNVVVTGYSIGGSTGAEDPSESVSFTFTKLCIYESASGANVCYDMATLKQG